MYFEIANQFFGAVGHSGEEIIYPEGVTPPTIEQLQQKQDEYYNSFEYNLSRVRKQRNILLLNCDWTQTVDCPLSDSEKTEWQTYRQSLRDITNGLATINDIKELVWPTEPE